MHRGTFITDEDSGTRLYVDRTKKVIVQILETMTFCGEIELFKTDVTGLYFHSIEGNTVDCIAI